VIAPPPRSLLRAHTPLAVCGEKMRPKLKVASNVTSLRPAVVAAWCAASAVLSSGRDPEELIRSSGWSGRDEIWRLPTVTEGHLEFLYRRNIVAWLNHPTVDAATSTLTIPAMSRRPIPPTINVPVEFCVENAPKPIRKSASAKAVARRRGFQPKVLDRVKQEMLRFGLDRIEKLTEVAMEAEFGASRDTCRRARNQLRQSPTK
jgi:hypothetical protein